MRPSEWQTPPIGPCDPISLDAIADLSDAELDALIGEPPAEPTAAEDRPGPSLPIPAPMPCGAGPDPPDRP
jgi:hypothetical protein